MSPAVSGPPEGCHRPVGAAAMLAHFHAVLGDEPGRGNAPLRVRLHGEEHRELVEALEAEDRAGIARELADIQIVSYGTAHAYDINLDAAVREVHRANLSKFEGPGLPLLREDGKVLKPPGWTAPDMTEALAGYPAGAHHSELLDRFAELEEGWDSYGAAAADPQALAAARLLLDAILAGRFDLVPTVDGGVQIEVRGDGREIDIEVLPGGEVAGVWEASQPEAQS